GLELDGPAVSGRPSRPEESPMTARPGQTPTPPVLALPGTGSLLPVAGEYRLLRRLGLGSFGEVFEAEAPGGGRVAVKVLLRPVAHEAAQRELRALDLIKELRHPALLSPHLHWFVGDRLLIAMDLADGSLRERLQACQEAGLPGVPVGELLGYLVDAAD